jgi:antitoxin (DNA-binding transcriptional repressor) of toxin-antitoxin stability system
LRGVHVSHRDMPVAALAPAAQRRTSAAEPIRFGLPGVRPVNA